MKKIDILNSKLTAPDFKDTLERKSFSKLPEKLTNNRLMLITGGAGFGKTTLASQVVSISGISTAWFRMDETDRDFIVFIRYLWEGFAKLFNRDEDPPESVLYESTLYSKGRKSLLISFIQYVETYIDSEIVFVFDDYHTVEESSEINEAIVFLLEHLPVQVHFIITSRTHPLFPVSRLRVLRNIVEIGEKDLSFSEDEITGLFTSVFSTDVSEETVKILKKKTQGWVSGLILFYHSLKKSSSKSAEELLNKCNGSKNIFADYMEENLFYALDESKRDFLIKTSVLTNIDVDFANRFLEIEDGEFILEELERNHLFTCAIDEDRKCFAVHHLFREFLLKKLSREFGIERTGNLRIKASKLLEQEGKITEAIELYLDASEFSEACRLLQTEGTALLSKGRIRLLNSLLVRIPDRIACADPYIQFLYSHTLAHSGKLKEACDYGKRAYSLFTEGNFEIEAQTCLKGLGYIYYLTGDFTLAKRTFHSLLEKVGKKSALYIDTLSHLVFISSYTGDVEEADMCYSRGVSMLPHIESPHVSEELMIWLKLNHGFRYCFSGDFSKAFSCGIEALHIIERINLDSCLVYCLHLLSSACFYSGRYDLGLEYADRGFRFLEKKGLQNTQEAWLFLCSSSCRIIKGDYEKSIEESLVGLEIFREGGSFWGEACILIVLIIACKESGRIEDARDYFMECERIIKENKISWVEGKIYWLEALSLIGTENYQEALPYIEKSRELLGYSIYETFLLYLLYARCHWGKNDRENALRFFFKALDICNEYQYDFWIIYERKWIVPLLLEASSNEKYKSSVDRLLYEIDPDRLITEPPVTEKDIAALNYETSSFPGSGKLRIHLLGKFRISSGSTDISDDMWKSKKAKKLLKYLIISMEKGFVPKDVLMELLWPEEDSRLTSRRLHVVLPALRKTLEPDIERGKHSSFLLREKDAYMLNRDNIAFIDVERFTELYEKGMKEEGREKAISFLNDAKKLYKGDLLEEDPYEVWCEQLRESLKSKYLKVLYRLTDLYESENQLEKAICTAEAYIAADMFDENIYRRLMLIHAMAGNKAKVALTFEKCRKNIADELGCPLSGETVDLYNVLLLDKTSRKTN